MAGLAAAFLRVAGDEVRPHGVMAGQRVPSEDQSAVGAANGRDKRGQAFLTDGLRFLHPTHVHALDTLNRLQIIVQASEYEYAAVDMADGVARDLEALDSERFDDVRQQLMDGIGDAVLEFSGAQDGDGLGGGAEYETLRHAGTLS